MRVKEFGIYQLVRCILEVQNKDVVEWTSMVFLSVIVFFNIITLFSFIYPYMGKLQVGKRVFVISMLSVIVLNYFIFIYKGKYKRIISDYSEKAWANNFWSAIFALIYIIGSVALMFYLL